jgi:2-polyprenyl-3-methyl-5-hydroxy-6-metoxy-1,4-benzoquinol methylase
MNNKTINYYNKYTKSFIQTTRSVDFTNIQNKFLSYLPSGAFILDFGCGSGRDTKYFLKRNYNVTAIDGSEEICKEASKYTGIKVKQMLFEELNDQNIYDGIWACASILHLSKNDLFLVFHKMNKALKEFILQIPQLQIKEIWTTGDVREGRGDERWLNILICKGKIS